MGDLHLAGWVNGGVVLTQIGAFNMSDNPYSSSDQATTPLQSSTNVGLAFGAMGLFISLCPSLLLLRAIRSLYLELLSMPETPESIRPMGLVGAMFILMGIGLLIATPIALLCARQAKKLNSRLGTMLSLVGAMLFWLPWPILGYGLDWICRRTGTTLGL